MPSDLASDETILSLYKELSSLTSKRSYSRDLPCESFLVTYTDKCYLTERRSYDNAIESVIEISKSRSRSGRAFVNDLSRDRSYVRHVAAGDKQTENVSSNLSRFRVLCFITES